LRLFKMILRHLIVLNVGMLEISHIQVEICETYLVLFE
jgi:hypothetical protein